MKGQFNAVLLCVVALAIAPLSAAQEDDRRSLKERASQLWDARVRGDWAAVYRFLSPEETVNFTSEEFVAFKKDKGPFRFFSAELGEVTVADDIGWVEVTYTIQPTDYPGLPPTHVQVWDVWQKRDAWYPVPKAQRLQVPKLPPQLRPGEEEAALSKRVHEFWQAKQGQDWALIYQYLEPDYQARVPVAEFLKRRALFSYLAHRVEWVEVTDEHGRVKVAYTHKLNDPSLVKLEPKEDVLIEEWIKIDGQWYRQMSEAKLSGR